MKNITMIAAVGKKRELGINNKLIWKINEDMKFFKDNTMNKPVIMGRKTYSSLNKPLRNRKNIILTTQQISVPKEVIIMRNMRDLLEFIGNYKEEVMIIGGATVYKQFLKYANKLLLTEIDSTCKYADTYFPEFDKQEYEKEVLSEHIDSETGLKYKHLIYTKKKNN